MLEDSPIPISMVLLCQLKCSHTELEADARRRRAYPFDDLSFQSREKLAHAKARSSGDELNK